MPATSVLHVLRTIRDRASVSRTDLQHITGLSWGTVTNTTRDLLSRKLIREEGAQSSRAGRKPMRLTLDAQGHCLIGCEMAPAHIRCVAATLSGQILSEESISSASGDVGIPRARIAELIRRAQQAAGERRVLGVGLCLVEPASTAGSREDLQRALQSQLNLPVTTLGRAASLALAERWFGAAPADDLLCVELDAAVSLGILLAGEPFRGTSHIAGNFGHISVDPNGPACECGNRGCVNTFCSAPALVAFAREAGANGSPATFEELARMADAGETRARAAFERMGQHLALAVNNLVQIFEPALVVLAGKSIAASALFTPALERHLVRRGDAPPVPIVVSQLGARAPALGAAAAILQAILTPNSHG
jgi:N-acetylglucosamine repressor